MVPVESVKEVGLVEVDEVEFEVEGVRAAQPARMRLAANVRTTRLRARCMVASC